MINVNDIVRTRQGNGMVLFVGHKIFSKPAYLKIRLDDGRTVFYDEDLVEKIGEQKRLSA